MVAPSSAVSSAAPAGAVAMCRLCKQWLTAHHMIRHAIIMAMRFTQNYPVQMDGTSAGGAPGADPSHPPPAPHHVIDATALRPHVGEAVPTLSAKAKRTWDRASLKQRAQILSVAADREAAAGGGGGGNGGSGGR